MLEQWAGMTRVDSTDAARNVAEQVRRIRERLLGIRYTVAVMSGKGGVGKSMLAANLAVSLRLRGSKVAIVDADMTAPSIARMLGIRPGALESTQDGVTPLRDEREIAVMGLSSRLLSDPDAPRAREATSAEAYLWRGSAELGTLRSFLADTAWGELDYLIVDLPSGGDRLAYLTGLIPTLSAVVLVSVPSDAAGLAAMRTVAMAQELEAPLAGLVENMSGYQCLSCGRLGPLFGEGGEVRRLAEEAGLTLMAHVPFDPRLAKSLDRGVPFVTGYPDAPAAVQLQQAADALVAFLEQKRTPEPGGGEFTDEALSLSLSEGDGACECPDGAAVPERATDAAPEAAPPAPATPSDKPSPQPRSRRSKGGASSRRRDSAPPSEEPSDTERRAS